MSEEQIPSQRCFFKKNHPSSFFFLRRQQKACKMRPDDETFVWGIFLRRDLSIILPICFMVSSW